MLIGRLYRVKLPSHIPQKKQRVFHPRSMAAAGEGGGGVLGQYRRSSAIFKSTVFTSRSVCVNGYKMRRQGFQASTVGCDITVTSGVE